MLRNVTLAVLLTWGSWSNGWAADLKVLPADMVLTGPRASQQLLAHIECPLSFDLHHHHRIGVHVLDYLRDVALLIVHLRTAQAVTADAERRSSPEIK